MRVFIAIRDSGDGSVSLHFFKDSKSAEAFLEDDVRRFCDDVESYELPLDPERTAFAVGGEVDSKWTWLTYAPGELMRWHPANE